MRTALTTILLAGWVTGTASADTAWHDEYVNGARWIQGYDATDTTTWRAESDGCTYEATPGQVTLACGEVRVTCTAGLGPGTIRMHGAAGEQAMVRADDGMFRDDPWQGIAQLTATGTQSWRLYDAGRRGATTFTDTSAADTPVLAQWYRACRGNTGVPRPAATYRHDPDYRMPGGRGGMGDRTRCKALISATINMPRAGRAAIARAAEAAPLTASGQTAMAEHWLERRLLMDQFERDLHRISDECADDEPRTQYSYEWCRIAVHRRAAIRPIREWLLRGYADADRLTPGAMALWQTLGIPGDDLPRPIRYPGWRE